VSDRQQNIARLLRRRRMIHAAAMGMVGCLILLICLDRAGAFGDRSRDWDAFNRRAFPVVKVISGDELIIRDERGIEQTVSLLGVDAPDPPVGYWSAQAAEYLTNRTRGRTVIIRFDTTRSRDSRGNLLAYVFITDGDNLNLDIIRDGQAYADRRKQHTLKSQFSTVETEARKKPRGLWKELKFEDMPVWRQEWVRSLKR